MLNQKRIWTNTGVPLKNQMYTHATEEIIRLLDRRMIASTTPMMMPATIETTVSSIVTKIPLKISGEKTYWRIISQP